MLLFANDTLPWAPVSERGRRRGEEEGGLSEKCIFPKLDPFAFENPSHRLNSSLLLSLQKRKLETQRWRERESEGERERKAEEGEKYHYSGVSLMFKE